MSKTALITSFLKGGGGGTAGVPNPKPAPPTAAPPAAPPAPPTRGSAPTAAPAAPSPLDAFFASLTPAQRFAHAIAKTSLGTSYDPERTHDYQRYIEKK